jgi:hypothetical protein
VVTNGSKVLSSLAYTSANTASTIVSRGASGEIAVGAVNAAGTLGVAGYSTLGDDAAPAFKVKKITPSNFTLDGSSETHISHGISSGNTRIKHICGCYTTLPNFDKRPIRTGDTPSGDLGLVAWNNSTFSLRNGYGSAVSYYDITVYITYEA